MNVPTTPLTCTIELGPGEKLQLPASLIESVGEGCWIITVQPVARVDESVREHSGLLKSYSVTDEGLYDDIHCG